MDTWAQRPKGIHIVCSYNQDEMCVPDLKRIKYTMVKGLVYWSVEQFTQELCILLLWNQRTLNLWRNESHRRINCAVI